MKIRKSKSLANQALGVITALLLFSLLAGGPGGYADDSAASAAEATVQSADSDGDGPIDSGKAAAGIPLVKVVKAKDVGKLVKKSKGGALLVNFWATWCPPCVAEMPALAKFFQKYKERGVAFLSLSADGTDNIDSAVRPFMEKHALPFPVYVLDGASPADLTAALSTEPSGALPETYLYSPEGVLTNVWSEEVTFEMLSDAVEPLLEEQTV